MKRQVNVMRIRPIITPLLFVALMLGTVFAAQQLGLWSTSGRASVDLQGFDAVEIKGWMTLQQISDGTGIPLDQVYQRANIPADVPANTAVKDLEGMIEGFETSVLREALAGPAASPAPDATQLPTPLPTIAPTVLPAGQGLQPAEIKGRMSLREVSVAGSVQLYALLAALGLPEAKADTPIKDLINAGDLSDMNAVRDAAAKLQSP